MINLNEKCLNLGSYNYLGFAENEGPCTDAVEQAVYDFGTSLGTSRLEFGTTNVHRDLERFLFNQTYEDEENYLL
jgi:serine palmitoyltransferase